MSESKAVRPGNPYRERSTLWSVLEGQLQEEYDGLSGWSDLTTQQIAEVLCVKKHAVKDAIFFIQRDTGVRVSYAPTPPGRPGHGQ